MNSFMCVTPLQVTGFPIRRPPDRCVLTTPRSVSPFAASFFSLSMPRHPPYALLLLICFLFSLTLELSFNLFPLKSSFQLSRKTPFCLSSVIRFSKNDSTFERSLDLSKLNRNSSLSSSFSLERR